MSSRICPGPRQTGFIRQLVLRIPHVLRYVLECEDKGIQWNQCQQILQDAYANQDPTSAQHDIT